MNILFLAHRAPFPPDRGDKIRSYHVLHYLAARARVHLVAFGETEADFEPPRELAEVLASVSIVPRTKSRTRAAVEALASGCPVSISAFADRRLAAAIADVGQVDVAYVFSGQRAQYIPACTSAVMDFVDVDSAKFAALANRAAPLTARMLRREAKLLGRYERSVADTAAATLFVSEAEAQLFRDGGGTGRVETVENGIDAATYDPATVVPVTAPNPLIVFTGQMDYAPNIEAVSWFVAYILPLLPTVQFAIVGRAPTAAVRALAGDRVIVTGAVDDVRGWLAAADVCVAPLQLARGIQNKVLEAMAMARPVVASTAAAEGIDHGGTILVAGDAMEHVRHITDLLADPAAAQRLGDAARRHVLTRYDWSARLAPLDRMIGL